VIRGEARRRHPRRIGEPVALNVEIPVDQGVAVLGRVRRVHRDDHVLDPAHRARILPADRRGGRALLRLPRLIEDQDPAFGAEVAGEEGAHRIPRRVLVQRGALEQVVQAVRPRQAHCLRDRPAVARDLRHQQPTQVQQAVRPHLAAAADRGEVRSELGECRFRKSGIYTGGAGRPVFVMRHNIMITGRPARAQPPARADTVRISFAAQYG
jgi:hypothetical protein